MAPFSILTMLDARRAYLLLAAGALLGGILIACDGASNELTGEATYTKGGLRGAGTIVHITRQSEPVKFRQVTNLRWGLSLICFTVAIVGIRGYQRLDDCT